MLGNDNTNDARDQSQSPQNITSPNRNTSTPQPINLQNACQSSTSTNQRIEFDFPEWNDPASHITNQTRHIWNPAFNYSRSYINSQNEYNRTHHSRIHPYSSSFSSSSSSSSASATTSSFAYNRINHRCPYHRSYDYQLTETERSNIEAIARNFVSGQPYQNNNQISARQTLAYFARRIQERDNYLNQQLDDSLCTDFSSETSDQYSDLSSSMSSDYLDRSDGSESVDR
ncbi:hypothetical protein PV328_004404 [Microctonus aethiopoides]|uniref:Uncharacterized protein n=1 Tax=Microctonus aethiopoides TaxID=144406 RepID=A0AA39FAJ2_9HYME|nr:hypothetical protein PV328_004404 [Microctonus aethiopoides]